MPETMESAMLALWDELTGAQMLQAVADGRVPHGAHHTLLGLRVTGARPGRVEETWQPPAALSNLAGSGVHAGYIAMVLDDACCAAGSSQGEHAYPMITLSLDIDFLRPVRPGGDYTVHSDLVHPGRRRMVANARVLDADGAPVTQARAGVVPDLDFASRMRTPPAPEGES
ncbi:PaaI family thioesterase [Streptomyces boncukensis]|uniref:PaaI family thioesterase n=1 Tax=Streptomyces boncukensis TaxID=2711219 RepID=A0A6G4WNJ8_9ACTN|nr:PaaI family thioesterase [Streptomyces boncukensis]NGO66846.1 PaaI family thioesterase [Streptomyces boncukensis]